MSSRSSVSEAAYLGMITVVALTIAIIAAGEINHLNRPLWRGQDLPYGGEIVVVIVVVVVVVGIKDFSVSESSAAQAGGSGWPTAGGASAWSNPSIPAPQGHRSATGLATSYIAVSRQSSSVERFATKRLERSACGPERITGHGSSSKDISSSAVGISK